MTGLKRRKSVFRFIIRKIRLLFNAKKEPYLFFHRMLGFYPDDIRIYELALHHKSMPIHTADGRNLCNERLEFLGDAVLNSVIADILYERFPNEREGFLTSLRSKIVSRESLNQIAREIGLDKAVVASKYVNKHANRNIYGNTLEALFGAIYVDLGYRKCKAFVEERLFCHSLDWNDLIEKEDNFKSKLLEWCHKRHLEPEFILLKETVQNDTHTFYTRLKINGHIVSEASGNSKKESQKKAAEIAYQKICDDANFLKDINQRRAATDTSAPCDE